MPTWYFGLELNINVVLFQILCTHGVIFLDKPTLAFMVLIVKGDIFLNVPLGSVNIYIPFDDIRTAVLIFLMIARHKVHV